jgi:hypothetical protein
MPQCVGRMFLRNLLLTLILPMRVPFAAQLSLFYLNVNYEYDSLLRYSTV